MLPFQENTEYPAGEAAMPASAVSLREVPHNTEYCYSELVQHVLFSKSFCDVIWSPDGLNWAAVLWEIQIIKGEELLQYADIYNYRLF